MPFNLCGGAARYARGADPRLATVKFFVSVDPVTPGVGEAVQKEALLYDDMVLIHHETEAGGPVHFTQQQHVFALNLRFDRGIYVLFNWLRGRLERDES